MTWLFHIINIVKDSSIYSRFNPFSATSDYDPYTYFLLLFLMAVDP